MYQVLNKTVVTYVFVVSYIFSSYFGNKTNCSTPYWFTGNSLANKNLDGKDIHSKQFEAKNFNNAEGARKNAEDENDTCDCFDMKNASKNLIARSFTKKQLNRKLPITDWLPKYNVEYFVSDLIAGVTVGLTIIPQGIAYALVAELPPQVS